MMVVPLAARFKRFREPSAKLSHVLRGKSRTPILETVFNVSSPIGVVFLACQIQSPKTHIQVIVEESDTTSLLIFPELGGSIEEHVVRSIPIVLGFFHRDPVRIPL
jgi:hypothetical protein